MSEIETGAEIVVPEALFWRLVVAWSEPSAAGLAEGIAAATAACSEIGAELVDGVTHYRVRAPDGRLLELRVAGGAVRISVVE